MRRIIPGLFTALAVLAFPPTVLAQQAGKVYRIGFLSYGKASAFKLRLAAFRQGMANLGYVEGRTFVMLERYAEGWRDRIPALAGELVRLAPDVIVTHGGPQAVTADRMARQTGITIPLVFAVDPDPVGRGIVASLARPGGNITGLSVSPGDLVRKRLALLKETFPALTRVAVLYNGRRHDDQLAAIRSAAPLLGLTIMPVKLSTPDDLPRAFDTLRRNRPRGARRSRIYSRGQLTTADRGVRNRERPADRRHQRGKCRGRLSDDLRQ